MNSRSTCLSLAEEKLSLTILPTTSRVTLHQGSTECYEKVQWKEGIYTGRTERLFKQNNLPRQEDGEELDEVYTKVLKRRACTFDEWKEKFG